MKCQPIDPLGKDSTNYHIQSVSQSTNRTVTLQKSPGAQIARFAPETGRDPEEEEEEDKGDEDGVREAVPFCGGILEEKPYLFVEYYM